ncbi:Imm8 family immunity protein, partial [Bacillus thuringiensis]|nr:Imm8 family immunity protein [Bacillus thuringiensis]
DIGTKDEEGVEYFYFRIISSKRLLSMLKEDSIIDCRATFIVNEFNIELIEREINKILKDCIRSTWEEVAQAINRYLCWEYDNIKYETF